MRQWCKPLEYGAKSLSGVQLQPTAASRRGFHFLNLHDRGLRFELASACILRQRRYDSFFSGWPVGSILPHGFLWQCFLPNFGATSD
jgi:hypothetical protein